MRPAPARQPTDQPDQAAAAQDGESVQQLLTRLGADPATWRSAMAGLTSPLGLTAGAQVQLDASITAGAGIGVSAGFSAGRRPVRRRARPGGCPGSRPAARPGGRALAAEVSAGFDFSAQARDRGRRPGGLARRGECRGGGAGRGSRPGRGRVRARRCRRRRPRLARACSPRQRRTPASPRPAARSRCRVGRRGRRDLAGGIGAWPGPRVDSRRGGRSVASAGGRSDPLGRGLRARGRGRPRRPRPPAGGHPRDDLRAGRSHATPPVTLRRSMRGRSPDSGHAAADDSVVR